MKKTFFSIFFLLLLTTSFAQTADKKADIKKLLEVTGTGKLAAQMSRQMFDALQTNYTEVDKKFFEEFASEIKADDLINLLIPIYDKFYSHDDIKQLIAFYQTPIGQKVINTLPAISVESMQAGQQWGKGLAEKVIARMKEQGYLGAEEK